MFVLTARTGKTAGRGGVVIVRAASIVAVASPPPAPSAALISGAVRRWSRGSPTTALRSMSSRRLSEGMEDPSGPRPNDRTYADKFRRRERPADGRRVVGSEPASSPDISAAAADDCDRDDDDDDDDSDDDSITYRPIAIASSPFKERHGAPRQPGTEGVRGASPGSIVLLPSNLGGPDAARSLLSGLEGFTHVVVVSHMHLNTGWSPAVAPPRLRHLDDGTVEGRSRSRRGTLATRAPHRPNPVGLSVLPLRRVDVDSATLHVDNVDLLDGTPVLDVKPYVPRYDSFPAARAGWIDDVDAMERDGTMPEVTHDGGKSAREAAREAARHRKTYRVRAAGEGGAAEVLTDTGKALRTDVPEEMGGTDTGPQPVEHLLAALVGCCQATAVFVGRMTKNPRRLLVDGIDFDLEAYRDERGATGRPVEISPEVPARLRRVWGTATVRFRGGTDPPVSAEEMRLLAERTEERCPVANMMRASGCAIDIEWVAADAATGGRQKDE